MDSRSYKTVMANPQTVKKEWVLVDAENQTLGRFTSRIAKILRGKHKPSFTPHTDCGDHVIVINAEKIKISGKKMDDKVYTRYTGYPGGQRFMSPAEALVKKPEFIIEQAIKGMLPKTRLGRACFRNLHVVKGPTHKFEAQKPKVLNFNETKI
ncbi:MAG: 50S ribosomal protein L13 [Flavobacteriales bacterium]